MDRNNNDKNDCEEKNKIDITGCEIVTLACTNISILEHDRDKFIK